MQEENVKHNIIVDNLKNGEILSYSLVLCKGHIENVLNTNCKSSRLSYKTNHDLIRESTVNNNTLTFKILIDLTLGDNILELMYCCAYKKIILQHNDPNRELSILPLYIICDGHDGRFQSPSNQINTPASACKRIMTGCKLIQSFLAEKLQEFGFVKKTFCLASNKCYIFYSKLHYKEAIKMGQLDLWYYFAREVMASSIGSNNLKYLAFLSCTKYNRYKYSGNIKDHFEILRLTEGYVAFGGDGLALLGTACLYTWPECVTEIVTRFEDDTLVDKTQFMDDSSFKGTLSGCFATTLGAALHELCHTFGLGHTKTGIMGHDFNNIQLEFLNDEGSITKYNLGFDRKIDGTYWTENCLMFLFYQKWFNNTVTNKKCILSYDPYTKVIKSTAGLRVVEIRSENDEMVLQYWIFKGRVLKYSFQIKNNTLCKSILVIQDNDGNILKENL